MGELGSFLIPRKVMEKEAITGKNNTGTQALMKQGYPYSSHRVLTQAVGVRRQRGQLRIASGEAGCHPAGTLRQSPALSQAPFTGWERAVVSVTSAVHGKYTHSVSAVW